MTDLGYAIAYVRLKKRLERLQDRVEQLEKQLEQVEKTLCPECKKKFKEVLLESETKRNKR